jgi:hypothetical protein
MVDDPVLQEDVVGCKGSHPCCSRRGEVKTHTGSWKGHDERWSTALRVLQMEVSCRLKVPKRIG